MKTGIGTAHLIHEHLLGLLLGSCKILVNGCPPSLEASSLGGKRMDVFLSSGAIVQELSLLHTNNSIAYYQV
jgi:hypothetical protein